MLSIQAKVRKEIFYAFLPITDARGGMDMHLGNMVTGFKTEDDLK